MKDTVEAVFRMLLGNQNRFLSGEEMGKVLFISRVSVNKAVKSLERVGFKIEKKHGLGYKLEEIPNKMLPFLVHNELEKKNVSDIEYYYLEKVESTQDWAMKSKPAQGMKWAVYVADIQTRGRGRFNRNWESPKGGLWMSISFSPNISVVGASLLSVSAAYCIVRALKEGFGIDALVKWPNDIILNGYKVGGILVTTKSEADVLEKVVLGIGLNVNFERSELGPVRFPASTILSETSRMINISALFAEIMRIMKELLLDCVLNPKDHKQEVEELLWNRNKHVELEKPDGSIIFGKLKGLDENYSLILETKKGEEKLLSAEFLGYEG